MREPSELPEGLSADDLRLPGAASAEPSSSATPSLTSSPAFDHAHAAHHPESHPHQVHHALELEETGPSVDGFIDGWQLGLYRDAVIAGALGAVALALLGVFIVLRRAVFAAATVGQAAGFGVVFAFYAAAHYDLELPPMLGALLAAVLATGALALRGRGRALPEDASLGLAFLVASAGAVALGSRITQEAHEVSSILFGSAVAVESSDVVLLGVLALSVLVCVALSWRGLAFAGFDPDGARVQQVPVRGLSIGLWLLVAISIAVSTRVLGALPVFAFSVLPPLAAILGARRIENTLVLSAVIGALCAAGGYALAYFGELPVGATQALCCAVAFSLAWLARRR